MRTLGRVAQHFTQAVDRLLQRQLVIHEGISRPKTVAEFLACDDFLRTFQKGLQNLERLARKLLSHAGLANLTGLQVHLEDPKLYHPWLVGHGDPEPTLSQMKHS